MNASIFETFREASFAHQLFGASNFGIREPFHTHLMLQMPLSMSDNMNLFRDLRPPGQKASASTSNQPESARS
jgi:hypothetical protein